MLVGDHLHARGGSGRGLAGQEGDSSLRRTRRKTPWPSHGAIERVAAKGDALLLRIKVLASERRTRRHRRGCGRRRHWPRWGFPGRVHKVLQVRRCLWPLTLVPGVGRLLLGVCGASTAVARLDRRPLYRLKAAPGTGATVLSHRSRPPHLPLAFPDVSRSGAGHGLLWFHGESHVA